MGDAMSVKRMRPGPFPEPRSVKDVAASRLRYMMARGQFEGRLRVRSKATAEVDWSGGCEKPVYMGFRAARSRPQSRRGAVRRYSAVHVLEDVYEEVRPMIIRDSATVAGFCITALKCGRCGACLREKRRGLVRAVRDEAETCEWFGFFTGTVDTVYRTQLEAKAIQAGRARHGANFDWAGLPARERQQLVDEALWPWVSAMLMRVRKAVRSAGDDAWVRHLFHSEEHQDGALHVHGLIWSNRLLNRRLIENEWVIVPKGKSRKRATNAKGVRVLDGFEGRHTWKIGVTNCQVASSLEEDFAQKVHKLANYATKYALKDEGYKVRHSKHLGKPVAERLKAVRSETAARSGRFTRPCSARDLYAPPSTEGDEALKQSIIANCRAKAAAGPFNPAELVAALKEQGEKRLPDDLFIQVEAAIYEMIAAHQEKLDALSKSRADPSPQSLKDEDVPPF